MSEQTPELPEEEHRDAMAPPKDPCECWCMHCGRTFMSDQMWFQKVIGDPSGFDGYWMCPTANCGGAGFTFDIFPTDPDHPANAGWHYMEDEDEESGEEGEWDPSESKYTEMDDELADEEDMEGEEWKQGALSEEGTKETPAQADARREWEEQQRKYDEPDERPREVYWVDQRGEGPTTFGEDEIPY